jgi:hypothetical protein
MTPLKRVVFTAVAALAVCATAACSGGSATQVAASHRPTSSVAKTATVTSSLRPGVIIEKPVLWGAEVKTPSDVVVDRVDFLIDGHVRWTERNAPYQFNDGRLFAPWPLGAGAHRLGIRVIATVGGVVASNTTSVTVKPPPHVGPPVGTYRRTVTAADQARVQPYRDAQRGAFGDATPTGRWSLQVRPDGVLILDQVPHPPQYDPFFEPFVTGDHRFTLYDSAQWLQPHPDRDNNFCDPEASSDYRWAMSDSTLTITQVQKRCADRDIALVGAWRRT